MSKKISLTTWHKTRNRFFYGIAHDLKLVACQKFSEKFEKTTTIKMNDQHIEQAG